MQQRSEILCGSTKMARDGVPVVVKAMPKVFKSSEINRHTE